jgi:hypothetical protein
MMGESTELRRKFSIENEIGDLGDQPEQSFGDQGAHDSDRYGQSGQNEDASVRPEIA